MSSQDSLFPYDKEELLRSLERFDGTVTAEDVTDSVKYDNSRYVHTSFIEVLLECICAGLVKNDAQRAIVLAELCRRLSQSNFINEDLLLHTLPFRKELSKRFYDYIKKICGEVLPDEVFDFSTLSFLEENSTSFRNVYRTCFEELQEIGRGGFGVVCKARNKMTESLYAIKKISFNYKNDSRLCRVIREAKNIAVLNHPNVVHYNNAWTEAPSPEDDFDYSSSDSDSNSTSDDFICKVSYCSEDVSKVEENESFSSESTNFKSVKSNHYQFSRLKKNEYTSYSKDSDSVIFSEFPNSSNRNNSSFFGSDSEKHINLNFSHEYNAEKSDALDSVDKKDLKNSYVSHSNSDEGSEKSDDSVNFNVKAILYIQMEYCDCDLRHWLDERAKGNPLPFEMDVTNIFINILNGVVHIHSKGIIHRDLKPQNIFYSKSSNILKIGDFGLATLASCPEDVPEGSISNVHSANIGTLPYAAPEQIKGQSYDSKVDIYSLGIILIELLNNCSTIMELTEIIKEVKKGNFPNNMKEMPKLINLVRNLVKENPDERMSAKEILSYLRDDLEVTTLEEMKKALQEKELKLRLTEAALNEKDEEIMKLKALVNELQKLHPNQ